MSVGASAFRRWAAEAGLPESMAPLARAVGVSRTTLSAQLLRGRVRESVIIEASRALGIDPVESLSAFDEYDELAAGVRPPLQVEVLSQVTLNDAMTELLARRDPRRSDLLRPPRQWEDPPQYDSVRNWIDAVDPGTIRQSLSERFAVSPSNLATAITENKLRPRQLVEAARIAQTSLTSGLAAAGVLTLAEAGWPDGAREYTLSRLRDVALIELVQARLAGTLRGARRRASDEDAARRIQSTLG